MQEILIESLLTTGTQTRATIDREHVAALAEVLKAGKRFKDNVQVFKDADSKLWVADGHHRIQAYAEAGSRTARCDIHKGTQMDALRFALGANVDHGKRRTREDVQNAIRMAYENRAALGLPDVPSSKLIGDMVGVSHETANVQLAKFATWRDADKRTGKDGKTYRVPPLPPQYRKPPQQDTPRPPPPPPPENRRPPPPPPNRPAKAPAGPVDELGKPIPDHIQPLFDRSVEVNSMLADLSRAKCTLQAAEKVADPLYAETNIGAAVAAIQTAYDQVKATKPYAVCPYCRGVLAADCRGCGGRGAIGEFRYKTVVPRDLK